MQSTSLNTGFLNSAAETSEIFEPSAMEFSNRLDRLMSLQEAFLASLHRLSDSSAELKMSVGSGPKQSEWFARLDRDSRTLKTRQACFDLKTGKLGTELCQDFPRSGMIVGGMLFRLLPSVQGISENVSSSLLPTAICNDGTGSEYCYGANHTKILKLPGAVKAGLLPTATAADGERGGRGDLLAIVQGRPNKHCDWMLPTARASANENRQTKLTPSQLAGTHGLSLCAKVHSVLLPTATARDYKDTPGMSQTGANGRNRDDQLPRRIFANESVVKTGGTKQSLEFRCWFMGFPRDWTKPLAELPEMQSSRKRSGRSPKQSETKS